jgi:2-keto-4-pentenoate hydratase
VISAEEFDDAVAHHRPLARAGGRLPTLDEAYDVQREFVARRSERSGSSVAGYKIAFTSPAAQAAVETGGYASGVLLESDVRLSGSSVGLGERFDPILEVELVVRAVTPIDADMPREEIVRRTEVAAGLEIPESRFAGWFGGEYPALSFAEVVSDNCLAGLVVVGDRWTPTAGVELAGAGATLHHDGDLVREGSVDLVVPDPVTVLGWLVRQLGERGKALEAGQLVSTGTWTDTIRVEPGSYRATFGGDIGDVNVQVAR